MRHAPQFSFVRGLAFAAVLVCAVPAAGLLAQAAPDAPATDTAAVDPLADLPAGLHAKVDGIMEKAAQAKRASFSRKMRGTIEEIVKSTGITGRDSLKALETAAHDAGEASERECIALARKRIGRGYQRNTQQMALSINATVGTGGLAAVRSEGETPPDEQAVWTEALQRILSPKQLAVWQAKLEEDGKKENQELDKLVEMPVDRAREQIATTMRAQVAQMTTALDLPPERAEQLEALGKKAVEQSIDAYRVTVRRTLRSIQPVEQRQRMAAVNQPYFIPQGDDAPTNQAVWKNGLAALLTDADRQRLRDLQRERQTRRTVALGRMLLAVMDENVALTASQRERLQASAEHAAQADAALFPPDDPDNYYQFSREAFFAAAARVPEADARAVLDTVQWEHWQQACKAATEGKPNSVPGLPQKRAAVAEPESDPQPGNPEPEEVERLLSDGLDAKTGEQRRTLLATALLKVEDAARVTDLDEKTVAHLRTAARGTAEETLAFWKANVMQNMRSQMENGDPQNVRLLLANLSNSQFPQFNPQPENTPTWWDKTVGRELTGPQRAAWKRETDARTEYKDAAVALLVLAEFDRRYQLSAAQWEALPPLLAAVMRDYGPDIHRMFIYSAATLPWYFQTFTMFLPVAGISDSDLQGVLGKERWDRWAASPEQANAANYWQNIRQFHHQRKMEAGK